MISWLAQHRNALFDALGRLRKSPLNTLLSLLVIGISLTLPSAAWLLLDNVRSLAQGAANVQQISLFMSLDASRQDSEAVAQRLRQLSQGQNHESPNLRWRFVPRADALADLKAGPGMAEIISSLPQNPLPDAFIVDPVEHDAAALSALAEQFAQWPKVAHVQLDSAWVKRLDAFLRLGKNLIVLLSVLFASGLIAITFNTIRLQIFAQSAEIELAQLIGASSAFLQRPFHYFGALQGALGGLFAALLVAVGQHLLTPPVAELVTLYGGQFVLHGLSWSEHAILIASASALGWLGAQLSLLIHLQQNKSA
ncbi:MAG: permease-like cell division protein FtsX [Pseudomonadota bacterium]